jgi:hypothetical protein
MGFHWNPRSFDTTPMALDYLVQRPLFLRFGLWAKIQMLHSGCKSADGYISQGTEA